MLALSLTDPSNIITARSITEDREFVKCREVQEGKARALREKGHGKRPNATKALTVQDEEH